MMKATSERDTLVWTMDAQWHVCTRSKMRPQNSNNMVIYGVCNALHMSSMCDVHITQYNCFFWLFPLLQAFLVLCWCLKSWTVMQADGMLGMKLQRFPYVSSSDLKIWVHLGLRGFGASGLASFTLRRVQWTMFTRSGCWPLWLGWLGWLRKDRFRSSQDLLKSDFIWGSETKASNLRRGDWWGRWGAQTWMICGNLWRSHAITMICFAVLWNWIKGWHWHVGWRWLESVVLIQDVLNVLFVQDTLCFTSETCASVKPIFWRLDIPWKSWKFWECTFYHLLLKYWINLSTWSELIWCNISDLWWDTTVASNRFRWMEFVPASILLCHC